MKKSKKAQDTEEIIKINFDDFYKEAKEYANAQVTKSFYGEDTVYKTMGKINNQIEAYRSIYKNKPILILISKELEILFRMKLEIMNQHEMVMLNGEPIHINRVFGLGCITTPVLKDLEFKVI